ncbi:tRNA pseudouridine(38-40) synthase TruA [Acuticoccus sp. I52.16.1]|uniref:tRNA pseudouridine(38-40) synthase TruA n=1 Tax=Acuticoccus sp. I52.16.1 TaxID=2928472 RepID=UPI001FD41D7A|nr:tRNA pseudouridine(38-40) synthase TruA [Acuticoccus sp. I52.16.1]UOM35169.1 tRNA pseudouridine(38-40) synthase TruA [Acuticoccus sp. I52.16.1]
MPRYKLTIEYDGTPYVGWQCQETGRAVQEALEDALEKFVGTATRVHGAGRTDTGVHATGQVAHVDLAKDWRADTVRDAVNAHLRPEPVAVLSAERVGDDFDARHSARARHYLYRIVNRRPPLALERAAWRVPQPLDVAAMNAAAAHLVGRHDFTTFRAAQCQAKSPLRTLDRLDVTRSGERIEVRASARSFLHNQVRSMVGTLVEVGIGRWQPRDVAAALAARSRPACGPVAPAVGLVLTRVDYAPQEDEES